VQLRVSLNASSGTQGLLVLYIQPTLGPAHFARIRALDRQPGFRCLGVQLASRERSRDYQPAGDDRDRMETLVDGVYEEQPWHRVIGAGWKLLSRSRPAAIVVDRPSDPVQSILAALARRRGVLALTRWASIETDFERKPWKEYLKGFLYRRFDGYLVTGRRARAYLEAFAVPSQRIFECGNPSDERFSRIAASAGIAPRTESFLYAGRFLPFKNLTRLVAAFARYRAAGGTWNLELVGFGDEESTLRAEAATVPGVTFLGHLQIEALARAYSRAGCLVLPSVSEPWGLVVNEAMDCGTPVIVSRRCGCFPELVDEGANGFGIDPLDTEQIAETLRRFAVLSIEARAGMALRSREIARLHGADAWAVHVAEAIRTIRAQARGPDGEAGHRECGGVERRGDADQARQG
jgi:glycosyltransferase involved in cell wall biosynthesis